MDTTYLAKVYLIKDDLIGMSDTPEPGYECKHRHDRDGQLVIPLIALLRGLVWLCLLQDICDLLYNLLRERLGVWCCWALLVLGGRALPHLAAW
jgi:hypothetical protein